jgi:voltage-dependent calcium channel
MGSAIVAKLQRKVLSNVYGLINLIFFLFLMTFFVGILACQLIRGDIPTFDLNGNQYEISFRTVWNSFLGMYQILSSENWTQILYAATSFQTQYHVAWISAAFLILWFIIGNNVVLSMFIAVIVWKSE